MRARSGGVIDLVAVQVQDRQHGPIRDRVEKLVAVPARGERTGLGFAVTHHDQSDQVRMVVDGPVGVRDAVAQLTPLVDAAGRFRSGVAANPAGERKLLEEALHPRQVLALVRVNLGIRSFEIGLGQNSRRTVAGPGDENRIQVVLVDQPVEVDVGKGLAGVRAPMAQQSWPWCAPASAVPAATGCL